MRAVRVGIKQYLFNILVSIDQLANVVLLGGDPDETISSVTGKYWRKFKALKLLRKFLNEVDEDHTEEAIESDEGKNSVWAVIKRET